ncbi:carboxypeptidase regulatory-like domain-containing protein [Oxalobacteraceae bacterium]|nr:carboxypeptidase regulatory-like domain-containing protein [Oxalobacteraceae bacterium]
MLLLFALAPTARADAPAADAVCVASALNRNATLQQGGYYMIPGVPSQLGNYRIRAVCNDGTLGQTGIVQPAGGNAFVAGPILWGSTTPIPRALQIDGPGNISYGQSVQLKVIAKGTDGSTFDATGSASGTNYTISNPQIASISADGLLTINPAPAGADYGRQLVVSVTNEGTAGSRLIQIGPRVTLTGRVTLANGQTPVAGAQVTVQLNAPLTVYPVLQTDAAGNFSLPNAPAGDYTLSALVPASGARGSMQAILPANGPAPALNLKLSGQGTLVLAVQGAAGAPVSGAQLLVAHEQYAGLVRSVQTGANGEAQLAFTAGSINVTVRDPASGAVATARGELADGVQLRLALQLQQAAAIGGRVLDGSVAQAGVQVRLLSDQRGLVSQAASGADGSFRFDSLLLADGPYTLQAVKDGRIQGSVANLVLAGPGQELQQDIVLGSIAAAGSVTGKVSDALGQVMANVELTLLAADGRQFGARSDNQGRYRIDGVPLGEFMVSASQGGAGAVVNGVLRTSGELVTADLQLLAAGQVAGRLLLPNGLPAAATLVTLRHVQTGTRQTRTDSNGNFNFGSVPLGMYVLTAQLESGERVLLPSALTQAGEVRGHTLRLLGLSTLSVQLSEQGQPAANTRVRLALQGALPYGAEAVSDANGVARFQNVPKSAFSLSVLPKANYGAVARYEGVLRQDSETVALVLGGGRAAYGVSGTVLDGAAKPVANQWVRLSSRDMPTGGTVAIPNPEWDEILVPTDADGRFVFSNVSLNDDGRGRLKLEAVVDGRVRGRMLLDTPQAGASVQQDLALWDAGAIAVSVRTPDGRPVAASALELSGFDDRLFAAGDFSAISDEDGGYLFVPPVGQWQVRSVALDGSQSSTLTLTTAAGVAMPAAFTMNPAPAYLRVQLVQRLSSTRADLLVNGQIKASLYGSGSMPYLALAAGENKVEVVTDYGDTQSQQVSVAAGDTVRVVPLLFTFKHALLEVRSNTSAAFSASDVRLDGRSVGSLYGSGTLYNIPLRSGQHELKIVTDYGDTRSVQLQVAEGDAAQDVQQSFAFNPPHLVVAVDATSAGTRVTVGGKSLPSAFAAHQTQHYYGMQPGDNLVVATAPGGKTHSSLISVGPDDGGKEFNASFLFDIALLKIKVINPKPVAYTQVWVDDRYIGYIGDNSVIPPYPVAKGQHKITVRNSDNQTVDNFILIGDAQLETTVEVNVSFSPAQLVVGIVNTAPAESTRVIVNGSEAGSVSGSAALSSYRLFVGDNQIMAVTASGDTQRSVLKVAELPAGLVLNTGFVFDRIKARTASMAFDGERHLYSVAVQPGDSLAVRVHGAVNANGQALNAVRAQVYGPDRQLRAEGYGSGYSGNYNLISTLGELMAIPVDAAGNATIAVQGENGERGGYFMSVLVNGRPAVVGDYLDGGKVAGTVLRDDGVTPVAGTTLVLRNSDGIGQHVRTVSAADGKFSFDHALQGEPVLSALSGETTVATAPLHLAAGQELRQDLRMPKDTRLQLRVTMPAGVSSPYYMAVDVSDLLGSRSEMVYFNGAASSEATEIRVLGDSVTLQASHPQLPGYSGTLTVSGADGQLVPAELKLRGALARGHVRQATGAPAPNIAVSVIALPGNTAYATTVTDAQGAYTLALPVGVDVVVRAYDASFDSYAVLPVAAPAGQDLALPDILLGARASVTGLVRYSAGTPLAGAQVVATATVNGKPFVAGASTGADGRFQLDGLPASVPLQIEVTAGPLNLVQRQSVMAAPGQVLALPDFVYEQGATLNILLLDGELQANPLLLQAQIGECGRNKVRVTTANGGTEMTAASPMQLLGMPEGPVSVQLFDACAREDDLPLAGISVEIGREAEYTATVVAPILQGTVKYADGRLVRYPSVTLQQQRPDGREKRLYSVTEAWNSEQNSMVGSFALVGLDLGDFSVTATDYRGGEVSATGNLAKPGNLKLDLVLPAQQYDHLSSDVVGLLTRDGKAQPGVDVTLVGANGWSTTVQTNEAGGYQFAEVPPGDFKVSAKRYSYLAEGNGSSGVDPLVTLDLAMLPGPYDGSASNVQGVVSVDGAGRSGLAVTLTLAGNGPPPPMLAAAPSTKAQATGQSAAIAVTPGNPGDFSTITGADGSYLFENVPAGDFTVQALSSWDSAQVIGHAGSAPLVTINLAIASEPFDGSASRLRGQVAIMGYGVPAALTLDSGGETLYTLADSNGNYEFPRVGAGSFQLSAVWDGVSARTAGTAGAVPVLTLDLALPQRTEGVRVSGRLRHSTGQPLVQPNIDLYQNGLSYHGWLDEAGNYVIDNVQAGPFLLRVEEGSTGLATMVSGVGAASGTLALDVVLPPSGTVSGTVTDHRGRALAGAWVYIRSSGQPELDRYIVAGDDGQYRMEQVALGQLQIAAQDTQTALLATGTQALTRDQQQVVQDLAMPLEVASMEGQVLGEDGITPVSDAAVTFASSRSFDLADMQWLQTRSDSGGRFVLPVLPTGAYSVAATDPVQPELAGISRGTATAGAALQSVIRLGTALPADTRVTLAGDGYVRLDCTGALMGGRVPNNEREWWMDSLLQLNVDGVRLPCMPAATASEDKRELSYGPVAMKSVQVQRRVFVPDNGSLVRIVDTFSNEGASAASIKVRVLAPAAGDGLGMLLAPAQTGYRYLVTANPPAALVAGSAGANQAGYFNYQPERYGFGGSAGYARSLTVPAGASVSLMYYVALAGDAAAAAAAAESLSGFQEPAMFDKLTPAQKAAIINFKLP